MAKDYTLLPARVREVVTAIDEAGMDPRAFRFEQVASMSDGETLVSRLVHIATGFYFQFDWAPNNRIIRTRPGRDAWREDFNVTTVDEQLKYLPTWLDLIARQVEAGDPLSEFGSERLFEDVGGTTNDPFTDAEREEFTRRLEGIRTLLLDKAADDASAVAATNERIDYLKGAMDRLGKRDWMFMAFGILIERGLELAMPNEQIRSLLGMLARGIQQLTGG